MSRLTDLLQQARGFDPKFAAELEREIRHSQNKRSFGLVFERHLPDAVELPTRPVRRGDTVYILPPRGSKESGDKTLWTVAKIDRKAEGGAKAVVVETKPAKDTEPELRDGVLVEDLVVVAQHDDVIYPGLVQTGEVVNSEDPEAPFHTVINSENLHALNLLTYTHRHKVDCIYIDPPYNTGAKDWKYNNDYVDGEDAYRHSKWLSFMEKRLELARELLNPEDSVLIVTIDEKEYLRLGLLLEQTFPGARIQMVSVNISPRGTSRKNEFSRINEFMFCAMLGNAAPASLSDKNVEAPARWQNLRRDEDSSMRSAGRPGQYYPIFIDEASGRISRVGNALSSNELPEQRPGEVAVLPVRKDGTEMVWGVRPETLRKLVDDGFVRVSAATNDHQPFHISYLRGVYKNVESGRFKVAGENPDGTKQVLAVGGRATAPRTVWDKTSHDAGAYGTNLIKNLLGSKRFDFPKSLYAVEDSLLSFLADKPNATVLDFFSGSGTTAHAVMRLNKQDGGRRRSISVTNNEVSFEESKKLTKDGFRPGDPEWERLGICDYVTKPRIESAITGRTPEGDPIKGDYKFTDEFPMADGFEANARFFTLTYEPPTMVRHGLAYKRVAPLLWLRAGQFGRVIESIPDKGWDVAESHGVIENVAAVEAFADAIREAGTVTTVYVVTDDALTFQSAVAKLSDFDVEFVQLYSTYLTNFAFTQSGGGI
ncbi:site-specific DNA-methyltransferase [Corynebacterium sp. CCUG 71335]|uniref:site-specific DNA-methyltransferase n=1 Tax=Corynebacterium sp. CCUG 71335 TaxID=2823892 RepID=UPI0021086A7D|nr:DNA methyltransferase [Corynebacterium sp. CCUG 71335]MCQ4620284.1 site-specific DNA-methyltransferase [Corynebacterium sp. CCUG 71335]